LFSIYWDSSIYCTWNFTTFDNSQKYIRCCCNYVIKYFFFIQKVIASNNYWITIFRRIKYLGICQPRCRTKRNKKSSATYSEHKEFITLLLKIKFYYHPTLCVIDCWTCLRPIMFFSIAYSHLVKSALFFIKIKILGFEDKQ
jgi:hypothetical protein